MTTSIPTQRRDWVDVSTADPSNPSGHKVPDGDAAIVAAHGQQGASSVEGAGESLTTRVQLRYHHCAENEQIQL